MYFVYILQSQLNLSFYKGQSEDLIARLNRHNGGKEKSTALYIPWSLVWYCIKPTRAEALHLEKKLKSINRQRTIDFIKKYPVDSNTGPDVTALR
jgi:putative endonuclease